MAVGTKVDPTGVPRPVDADRVEKASNNSGVVVGETTKPTVTTSGTVAEMPTTAFIKVYQDAGVIGLSLLTLVALCVLLGVFCLRLLKMYQALATSRENSDDNRTQAVEKLATAILLLRQDVMQNRVNSEALFTEIRADHDNQAKNVRDLCHAVNLASERSKASFDLLSLSLTGGYPAERRGLKQPRSEQPSEPEQGA